MIPNFVGKFKFYFQENTKLFLKFVKKPDANPYFCKISKDPSIAERAGIQPFWGFFRLFLRIFYWIGRYSGFFSLNRT